MPRQGASHLAYTQPTGSARLCGYLEKQVFQVGRPLVAPQVAAEHLSEDLNIVSTGGAVAKAEVIKAWSMGQMRSQDLM